MFEIFSYSFMINAFFAGLMVSVLSSVLGTFVVTKRYSMLSDSLSHVALLGVAFGFLFSISTTWSALCIALVMAWVIEYLRHYHNLYSDSILAIFLSGSLSLAIIIVSLSGAFNTTLFDYLFGSILAVTEEDLVLIAFFSLITLVLLAHNYRKLVFIAFDEEVAQTSGINVKKLNFLLVSLVAVTIGLSIKVVGALLIGALMVIPVVSALFFRRNFLQTTIIALIFSLLSVIIGLTLSFYVSVPSGATIVAVSLCFFLLSLLFKRNVR